jgi:hypothetical protein
MIHLIRNTFRYAPRQHWDELSRDLKPVYTAPTEAAALERFGEFEAKWATKYPAIGRLWRNAWTEFAPFLDWDAEIRRVICSTDEIVKSGASIFPGWLLLLLTGAAEAPGSRAAVGRRAAITAVTLEDGGAATVASLRHGPTGKRLRGLTLAGGG